jgi:hypothetical protein
MKIYIFLTLSICSSLANADTALIGKGTSPTCKDKMFTLWISENTSNQLLYQTDVPIKSSFKVHLIPGKYKFVLNNAEGCFSEEIIEISKTDSLVKKNFILKAK